MFSFTPSFNCDLHCRFIDKVDWFLISDDDTFVRVAPLRAYLSHLNHNKPHLIGGPVSSLQFLLEHDLKRYGPSAHCGGGSGIVMSRETLRRLRPHVDACLTAKHTLLNWYWDEVEFARCIYTLPSLQVRMRQQYATPAVNTNAPSPPPSPSAAQLYLPQRVLGKRIIFGRAGARERHLG
jgi:hypothetical protein